MKNEASMPVVAVGGMIVVGAVVATAAVFRAYAVGQCLDVLVQGRTAAILHLVLRGAMMNAVLCTALLVAFWRYWRIPSESVWKLLPLLLPVKIGAAVFAASSVARFFSMSAQRFLPSMMHPFAAIGGWRPFQILDLALLFVLMLLFVALADRMQRKIEAVSSMALRVTFTALAVCLFVVLASPIPYRITCELVERQNNDESEETEEPDPPQDNDYRIDADEPWEVRA